MERRITLKRLTASDLTFFAWHHHNHPAGNQKAINLNADVFIATLFPSLPDVATAELSGRVPLDLNIYGPSAAARHNLQRKIVKGTGYKNWRLNGEFINNPDDEPARYNILQAGDIAVFDFVGRVVPTSATVILISQSAASDRIIHEHLTQLLGTNSMVRVSVRELRTIADSLGGDDHPFCELTLDAELEDASLGGSRGRSALWKPRTRRVLTRAELEQARQRAVESGRVGEELICGYLADQKLRGAIADFVWESDVNAVAPYDFSVTLDTGQEIAVEVKSTVGEFDRPIHISLSELAEMAGARRYDVYRVFGATDQRGQLRILENAGRLGQSVLEALRHLPTNVQVDSVSVDPESLTFGATIELAAIASQG